MDDGRQDRLATAAIVLSILSILLNLLANDDLLRLCLNLIG